jgi:hypothetical protein
VILQAEEIIARLRAQLEQQQATIVFKERSCSSLQAGTEKMLAEIQMLRTKEIAYEDAKMRASDLEVRLTRVSLA